ncbi:MAG: DUF882 domain-containing protein [Alphaproteobacteria bacterium]|nr:DUF882 domain-containing protein [Alphaproteobacteria bacterium]MBV9553859.1 DUF882 domain-containing protein [Alphaproteobacteria bacterium]
MLSAALATPAAAGLPTTHAVEPPATLRRLKLVNAHTGETFSGPYRDNGGPIAAAMEDLSAFLRDHYSGETIDYDVGVIDFLACVMEAAGAAQATVLSAYRTRATNEMLARTTFGVADNSQHIFGRALDIYLPARLDVAMETARAMERGGVGWYPDSHFIHLDTGPVRNWDLGGMGFGTLLLELRRLIANGELSVSPKGELRLGDEKMPLTWRQRVALHRLVAKAEAAIAGGH